MAPIGTPTAIFTAAKRPIGSARGQSRAHAPPASWPCGAFLVQSSCRAPSSPSGYAKEAFLTIERTVEASGLKTLPYRVNVPSFGDWGFTLAWRDRPIDDIIDRFVQGGRIQNATFITPQIALSSLNFGRGELDSEFSDVNTLMRPVLLDRCLRRGWSKN